MNRGEYHERVTINAPHMPEQSEVINKLILNAIIMLGMTIGQLLATALFHFPGI